MKNIRFNVTPITKRPEFVKINAKNIIIDRQSVTKEDCFDFIVKLIDYLNEQGITELFEPKSNTTYLFCSTIDVKEQEE